MSLSDNNPLGLKPESKHFKVLVSLEDESNNSACNVFHRDVTMKIKHTISLVYVVIII